MNKAAQAINGILSLSQHELARVCNKAQQTVSMWLVDLNSPPPEAREAIRLLILEKTGINIPHEDWDERLSPRPKRMPNTKRKSAP